MADDLAITPLSAWRARCRTSSADADTGRSRGPASATAATTTCSGQLEDALQATARTAVWGLSPAGPEPEPVAAAPYVPSAICHPHPESELIAQSQLYMSGWEVVASERDPHAAPDAHFQPEQERFAEERAREMELEVRRAANTRLLDAERARLEEACTRPSCPRNCSRTRAGRMPHPRRSGSTAMRLRLRPSPSLSSSLTGRHEASRRSGLSWRSSPGGVTHGGRGFTFPPAAQGRPHRPVRVRRTAS